MESEKKVRRPAFSGYFYMSDPNSLRNQIEESFKSPIGPGELPRLNERGKRGIVALVSPHAGYVYSGSVAAHGYHSLAEDGKPDLIVLIGPNHTGYGSGVSLMNSGVWETPLGRVEIDEETAGKILDVSRIIDVDASAHMREHSLEVQIPFLQYTLGNFRFVPILMMMQNLKTSREVGGAVAKALEGKNSVIVASTDLTHYEPHASAKRKDTAVIEAILSLDEEKMMSLVYSLNVSMCGMGPVASAIYAAKTLGASEAKLLKYATSGDVTGDLSQVVGYASLKMTL
ncbi:MAG: AmmeMemoRadiSam system protein B [Candidatus Geothermarchaeales archaeon]